MNLTEIPAKKLRRVFYRGRMKHFRAIIVPMLIAGILLAAVCFFLFVYEHYAVAEADIVLTYPEIALSQKPDGSRFTYYDLISDEVIEAALASMQEKGFYTGFTVDELREQLRLSAYLKASAGDAVTSLRNQGSDFSYVANEFKLVFVQPHNRAAGLFPANRSVEFVSAIAEANRIMLAENSGGIDGFILLTGLRDVSRCDYSETIRIYRSHVNAIINYLNETGKKQPDFVSAEDGLTMEDLEGKYRFLLSDQLAGIGSFIESSGLTRDAELLNNRLAVNIENNALQYRKETDRSMINRYAMKNYDQTFTENLINVIQNKEYGLYQARPKTAFDTVVDQMHEADEASAEYTVTIDMLERELAAASSADRTPEEQARLEAKCEALIAAFLDDYDALTARSRALVGEFYEDVNESFLRYEADPVGILQKDMLVECAFSFAIGAAAAFVLAVFASIGKDIAKIGIKRRKLIRMKKMEGRDGE